jgi:hypothetical protein
MLTRPKSDWRTEAEESHAHIASAYPPVTDADRARLLADLEAHGAGNSYAALELRRQLDTRTVFDPMLSAADYRAMTPTARALWNQQWVEYLAAVHGDLARMDPHHHSNAVHVAEQLHRDNKYDEAREKDGHR